MSVRRDTVDLLNQTLAQQSTSAGVQTEALNSTLSEESIRAAMPDVRVPLITPRLYDDRNDGMNIMPLKDLKANCYG